MIKVPQIDGKDVAPSDWAVTPVNIQQLVEHLVAENEALKTRLSQLEERLGQNSRNSSKPPSQDGFGKKVIAKNKSKRPRGDQPGHAGNPPKFYELSAGDIIHNHIPTVCGSCGETLTGADEAPYRHQIQELPVLRPQITEHGLHQLNCEHCGHLTRAKLPESVGVSHYGERLTAAVGLLSSENVQSHSKVQTLMSQQFQIQKRLGRISRDGSRRAIEHKINKMLPVLKEEILGETENILKESLSSPALLPNVLIAEVNQL